jgi:hypothetical protein
MDKKTVLICGAAAVVLIGGVFVVYEIYKNKKKTTSCVTDSDCPRNGSCFHSECRKKGNCGLRDCPDGYHCLRAIIDKDRDFIMSFCNPDSAPKCSHTTDCPAGFGCMSGECYEHPSAPCRTDRECPDDWGCYGGQCKTSCSMDSECHDPQKCVDGKCA